MHIEYLNGFYAQEHDGIRPFRWMNGHVSIVISENSSRHVRISYGCNVPTTTLTIKGKHNSITHRLFEGWHTISIDLEFLGDGCIELICPYTFSPPIDQRVLSLQIGEFIDTNKTISLNELETNIHTLLDRYIAFYHKDEAEKAYCKRHITRYLKTLGYLAEHQFSPGTTLEIGGGGFFTHLAEMYYPSSNFYIDNSDIRKKTFIEDGALDSIMYGSI